MVKEEYLLDRHEPPDIERLRGTLQDITLAGRVAVIYECGAKVYIANKYPPDSLEEHMSVIEHRIDRPNYSYLRAWGDWVNVVKRAREEMLQAADSLAFTYGSLAILTTDANAPIFPSAAHRGFQRKPIRQR